MTVEPNSIHDDHFRRVGVYEKATRAIGQCFWLPRKLRSAIVRRLVGEQCQAKGKQFEKQIFGKHYVGVTSSHIDWHVFFFGTYDPVGTEFLRHIARQINPIFLDIGANTGTHMLAAVEYCKQVHCFEPFTPILRSLRENVNINQLTNVHVHPFGLYNEDGVFDFHCNEDGNHGAGTFKEPANQTDVNWDQSPALALPLKRGDQIVEELQLGEIGLVKIDVEGLEFDVLEGLLLTLKKNRPVVLWELNPIQTRVDQLSEIPDYFPDDYSFFRLDFTNRWDRARPCLVPLDSLETGNFIGIPSEQLHLIQEIVPTQRKHRFRIGAAMTKITRWIASEFRKLVIRIENPNCRFGKSVSIGKGVSIRVTDGGTCFIGKGSSLKDNCVVMVKRGNLKIGDHSFIGWGTIICSNESILIGKNALIAEHVSIRDQNHGMKLDSLPFNSQSMTTAPILIEENVWIGAKATITSGVTIGSNSVVGANSVATRDIAKNSLAVGTPAKVIRSLKNAER